MKNKQEINIIIFGATGMVGIEVLHNCIGNDKIKNIISVGRNTTGVNNQKLEEIEHNDFLDYSSLEPVLSNIDMCIYCVGVYQGKVTTEKFWEITCDYLKALVDSIERVHKDITFCLMSAQGADTSEKSPFLFAKAKGQAERILLESGIMRKYIFRPGFINPGRKKAISRIPAWMVKPFYKFIPSIGIDAPALANVMVEIGLDGCEQEILENKDIRKRAKLIIR